MNAEDLKSGLLELFSPHIAKSAVYNGNELYMVTAGDKAREVCVYTHKVLGYPLVSMFASDERPLNGQYAVYCMFADRENSLLLIVKQYVDEKRMEFGSLTDVIYAADLYEHEISDMYGIKMQGHPDMKRMVLHGNWPEGVYPLRKDFDRKCRPTYANLVNRMTSIRGEGIFEIPVGPVHAGIIEPGHFRFNVAGEPIINLEARLFYTHRGIEKACEGAGFEKCLYMAERISGDETFSNSLAYCQAIEKIARAEVPERAGYSRVIFAELERLTSHLGDLAGICVDVAYGFAASQFRMMRGWAYLLADDLCGMRFLRSVNRPGGLRKDFIGGKEQAVTGEIKRIRREFEDTVNIVRSNNMFIDRVENTGILKNETAKDLNAVGPAGRASGVCSDVRKDFPYECYGKLVFDIPRHGNGDVNCRMNVKMEECLQSMDLIMQAIESMPSGRTIEPVLRLEPYGQAVGMTESARGENVHWVVTGENDTVYRYKIRTPSFCNWPALCRAVNGNIIPDFPLINKSFNLSYAGNDL